MIIRSNKIINCNIGMNFLFSFFPVSISCLQEKLQVKYLILGKNLTMYAHIGSLARRVNRRRIDASRNGLASTAFVIIR